MLRLACCSAFAALLLAGCATRSPEVQVAVLAPPPPLVPPPPPERPAGLPDSLAVPAVDAAGDYLTINHGLDPAEAAWHLRGALNVAALGCRGADEAAIIAGYNAMLKAQRTSLAAALRTTEARYRAAFGRDAQAEHDRHQTRVYNFFAQPPGHDGFCAAATAVLAETAAVPPSGFVAYAAGALPRLEAPFTDVYRAYDKYRRELAAWQARYGDPVTVAFR